MTLPTDRKFSETHEWFLIEGDTVTIGITQHAADELTDITFVDLPAVGKKFNPGDTIGEVESVKATSEIFTSLPGEVIAVNTTLTEQPELINEDAFDEGWMIKLKLTGAMDAETLMDAKEYKAFVKALK